MRRLAFLFSICLIPLVFIGCKDDSKDNSRYIPGYGETTDENGDDGHYGVDPDVIGEEQIKVMSFNVRLSTGDTGEHAWANRRDACCALITKENPTIFGVQEALYDQMNYFRNNTDYEGIGVGRDDGATAGESTGIFYNPTYMKLETWDTFWLSETPDEVSKGFNADYTRTATWALFTHIFTGKKIFYINTHLDTNSAARGPEAELIVEKIAELNPNGYITILTADFNTSSTNSALSVLYTILDDARVNAPITDSHDTFNGWGTGNGVIDHIFYNQLTPLEFRTVTDIYLDVEYASDHWPVVALFDF